MNPFTPTAFIPRIEQLAFSKLRADGVRGIIVDLDNTLVGYRALAPAPEIVAWIAEARAHDIKIVMVTNNATPWAVDIANQLALPIVPRARKPLPGGFARAVCMMDLRREDVIVIGDQLFTDILGAKIAGLRTILVDPLVRRDPWNTLPLRLLERALLRDFPRTQTALADKEGL